MGFLPYVRKLYHEFRRSNRFGRDKGVYGAPLNVAIVGAGLRARPRRERFHTFSRSRTLRPEWRSLTLSFFTAIQIALRVPTSTTSSLALVMAV